MMHPSHRGDPCSMCGACPCHEPDKAIVECEPTGYIAVAQFIPTSGSS